MSNNFWRKRRVRKKGFRAITILDTKQTSKYFRPVFTKTKTIFKEVHTTIQRHDVNHNTYPLTLHLHTDTFHPQYHYMTHMPLYQTWNQPLYATQALASAPIQTFQFPNIHGSFHLLMEEQMHLEQKYFQSHPSKARQLAMSYLQQGVLRSVMQEFLHSKDVYSTSIQPLQKKSTFLQHYLNLQQIEELYKPVFVQSDVKAYYPVVPKRDTLQEEAIMVANDAKKEETAQVVSEKIDVPKIIRYVYEEVMRRIKQEGLRKGRR